jgi:hypothetical protein
MALPNRKGAVYAWLADPDYYPQGQARLDGTIIDDEQAVVPPGQPQPPIPKQRTFFSYKEYFPDYPPGFTVKVKDAIMGSEVQSGNTILFSVTSELEIKYPTGAEVNYNPTPPPEGPGDEPPDPNGTTGIYEESRDLGVFPALPRYVTDAPFSFSSGANYDWYAPRNFVPEKGERLDANSSGFDGFGIFGSWDVSVENLMSRVLNLETNEYEEYPYAQATTDVKVTTKIKAINDWEVCCWNDGTVVSGKIAIWTLDATTKTNPETGTGWFGMFVDTGTTFAPHTELDWSVTIEEGFDGPEIEIPKVEGKVSFINDIWITSVTPPPGPA